MLQQRIEVIPWVHYFTSSETQKRCV